MIIGAITNLALTTGHNFVPPPSPASNISLPKTVGSPANLTGWEKQWIEYARVAWGYFKPGVGVSSSTGLVYGSSYWHRFTDWDLAGYIEAILSAERIEILTQNGTWGSNYRLGLVLNFLETRQLAPNNNLPLHYYDSDTGGVPLEIGAQPGNPSDEGRLLISLHDILKMHPELSTEIQNVIQRVNYFALASCTFTGDYGYYVSIGFSLWGVLQFRLSNQK
jgi:hypothetical protein